MPLVAERYGSQDVAGDRLTLQFIYLLFPRPTTISPSTPNGISRATITADGATP